MDIKEWFVNNMQPVFIGIFGVIAGYFDTTITFLYALMLGFAFNIFAGMRADEVRFQMTRLLNIKLLNYSGGKLKDSLIELFLITVITYLLKIMVDLMNFDEKSTYVVQVLIALALYFYVKNGLKNLRKAYPHSSFIRAVYHIVSFKFKEMMPGYVNDAVELAEKEGEQDETK